MLDHSDLYDTTIIFVDRIAFATHHLFNLLKETLKDLNVERFSQISNEYKDQDFSMNLEGITVDKDGNIWIVSDNTSGKAACDQPAKEKTILLQLIKK